MHHDGQCRHPHGHSYVLTIHLKTMELNTCGPKKNMVQDFSDISRVVKPMVKELFDHKWLNDTLHTDSPTCEFIAQWIYRHLKPQLPNLNAITLHETPTSSVTYSE